MWERAGRLQDACDGSYFNGLPLFTGLTLTLTPAQVRNPISCAINDVTAKDVDEIKRLYRFLFCTGVRRT